MDADLIAEDRNGNPVLLVEVKTREAEAKDRFDLVGRLQSIHPSIPFGMLVDPERILILRSDCADPLSPILDVSAVEVLRTYDDEFVGLETPYATRKVYQSFLNGLVRAWLSDLADRWKPDEPPFVKAIEDLGLLERLKGGTVVEELLFQ